MGTVEFQAGKIQKIKIISEQMPWNFLWNWLFSTALPADFVLLILYEGKPPLYQSHN